MSSGPAFVRFEDGTVRFATYHGTVDILLPALFDTPEAASAGRDDAMWTPCPCGGDEPVAVWTLYGGGFGWMARACRHRVRDEFCEPWGSETQSGQVIHAAQELLREEPSWVRSVAP